MFAKREPSALRLRLARLSEDHKLGRLADAPFKQQAVEVIVALKKLGEEVRHRPGGMNARVATIAAVLAAPLPKPPRPPSIA